MQLNGNGSIDCIGTRIGALAFAREEARLGDCAACARLRDCGVASMLQLDVTCCLTEGGHASLRSFPGAGDPVSKGPETKGKSKSPDVRAIPAVVSHSQWCATLYRLKKVHWIRLEYQERGALCRRARCGSEVRGLHTTQIHISLSDSRPSLTVPPGSLPRSW